MNAYELDRLITQSIARRVMLDRIRARIRYTESLRACRAAAKVQS